MSAEKEAAAAAAGGGGVVEAYRSTHGRTDGGSHSLTHSVVRLSPSSPSVTRQCCAHLSAAVHASKGPADRQTDRHAPRQPTIGDHIGRPHRRTD